MRILVALLTIALCVLSGYAQAGPGGRKHRGAEQTQGDAKPKVDDKAYRNALGTLPNQKYDPWKDMR